MSIPRSDRRQFLRDASTAAMPLLFNTGESFGEFLLQQQKRFAVQIENQFFRAHFEVETGALHVWRKSDQLFLSDAVARATLPGGVRSTSGAEYVRRVEINRVRCPAFQKEALRARHHTRGRGRVAP